VKKVKRRTQKKRKLQEIIFVHLACSAFPNRNTYVYYRDNREVLFP